MATLRTACPTLEVHVPISPTPAFVNMAHYLVRSLRANGGRYRDAPMVLTVGADRIEPDFAERHPWMKACGVEVRWIDPHVFARESWLGTAAERFRHRFTSDVVLLLDADTLIAAPIDELVELTHRTGAVCGVVAHVPPFERGVWEELFRAEGLGVFRTPCEHTGWGYLFSDASMRYCPAYFNLGVVAAPASTMSAIGELVYDLMRAVEAQRPTSYRVQIALALAIVRLQLPFQALPFRWNFANDPHLEALHAPELPYLRIIHLLRAHQVAKAELFRSLDDVEAMLRRTDLRVVNAAAQQVMAAVHPAVVASTSR